MNGWNHKRFHLIYLIWNQQVQYRWERSKWFSWSRLAILVWPSAVHRTTCQVYLSSINDSSAHGSLQFAVLQRWRVIRYVRILSRFHCENVERQEERERRERTPRANADCVDGTEISWGWEKDEGHSNCRNQSDNVWVAPRCARSTFLLRSLHHCWELLSRTFSTSLKRGSLKEKECLTKWNRESEFSLKTDMCDVS